jgi:hypothetical protein
MLRPYADAMRRRRRCDAPSPAMRCAVAGDAMRRRRRCDARALRAETPIRPNGDALWHCGSA